MPSSPFPVTFCRFTISLRITKVAFTLVRSRLSYFNALTSAFRVISRLEGTRKTVVAVFFVVSGAEDVPMNLLTSTLSAAKWNVPFKASLCR